MSKGNVLASMMSRLFPKSEKAISEKLSTEEHNEFSAEALSLNEQIEANTTLTADLAVANATITTLTNDLATANEQVTSITKERDTFKAHYESAKKAGVVKGDDQNSSEEPAVASYNAHAMEAWAKVNKA